MYVELEMGNRAGGCWNGCLAVTKAWAIVGASVVLYQGQTMPGSGSVAEVVMKK